MKSYWTPEAIRDRTEIFDYIEHDNPRAALALDGLFEKAAQDLLSNPLIGRSGQVEGTREYVVSRNYLLVYDVVGDEVRVLRVWNPARGEWHTSG